MRPTTLPEESSFQSAHEICRERNGATRLVLLLIFIAVTLAGCAHHNVATHPPATTPAPQPGTPAGNAAPSRASGAPPAIERQPAVPGEYLEEGVASWYGIPFNGHRTSNGEIYDMHQFTAAHRTLPFNCVVRVTNLDNGKQTDVRINDRGPFVANRVIDLSLSAAQAIEMVGPGTAHVRLEIMSGPNPQAGFFGVQIGAFRVEENAEKLKAQLEASYSPVSVATYDSPNGTFYRVRVGRLPSEDAAQQLANQLHSAGQFTTFVVRLDN
ncbi:MAG: septal ring lytic transglycosylase RlpA family protein [Candidatus Acidiferrales bacterium]